MNLNMVHPPQLDVLYEDNHLLVVSKRAGIPTQGASADADSVVTLARQYVKRKYHKPGNAYIGVVSRLDSPVSGVLVLAKTSKAARRLNEQFRARTVHKRYWALIEGGPLQEEGQLIDWIRRDETLRRSQITGRGATDSQEARLSYRRLRTFSGICLLEVELQTGRKHQIRAQLAHRGWPIVGDRRYGSRRPFAEGIALHARRLEFAHPTQGERLVFEAPLPVAWTELGVK